MIKNVIKICVYIIFSYLLFTSGCGTLTNGSQHFLAVVSKPAGAKVTLNNTQHFDTPVTVVLDKKRNHTIIIELEGYLPYEIEVKRKFEWVLAGGEFLWFPPMLIVDLLTGGIYTMSPDRISTELDQKNESFSHQRQEIYIYVVLEPQPHMQKIASLIKKKPSL